MPRGQAGQAQKKGEGDGGSAAQKRAHGALPDAVRATKKSSTPVASGTTAEKGAEDKDKLTTNRNLAQGKESNAVRTATSYFDPVWNAFSKHTDGSMQWIPKQIVAIGEDFHSQVGDGKVRTTLYKVRWEGYDKKDDTWEPITHLQGYATMVKSFKESHAKDLEKLAADRQRQAEKKVTEDLVNARHVSDGDWGILPVHPTHQTDGAVPRRCSTCGVHCANMRICHPISEHVESGAALYQGWR